MMDGPDLSGRLLVAGPGLIDPNFALSVVLVGRHGDDGALGLILDRPTDIAVGEYLPGWVERLSDPPVVFVGGPVQREAAIGLARLLPGAEPPDGWEPLAGDTGLIDLAGAPGDVVGALAALRVFSGYAGWGTGQLDMEHATGDWLVVDAEPEDAFTTEPASLRPRVLRRNGGVLAMYAHLPPDPELN
jgi:putative transcriptional regulator